MKRHLYIYALLIATLFFTSCEKDGTTNDNPASHAEREALLQQTQIGMYKNGTLAYGFDKQAHQLYIYPELHIFRIQTDGGDKYLELRINSAPVTGTSVKGSLIDNTEESVTLPMQITLLKSTDEMLWLWDETTNRGFIMPWIVE